MEKIQRMQQLIDELNQASQAYYNGKAELMTDYEWDARFDELRRLEEETGDILPDSPTQKVSEDNVEGQKEEHEFPALSLAKTKQVADLVKWAEGRPIWISWKLDGLTLVVTYDNGRLSKVVTRGNGHIGTNITHLAKAIKGIPQTITDKSHVVIRGEAVIAYDDFNRFLLESGEDYANPRNLASGSLTLKDVEEVKRRNLQWIPFTLVYTQHDITSWGKRMELLDTLGFTTVERAQVEAPTHSHLQATIDQFTVHVTEGKNPFPVDGLVVTYDDTDFNGKGTATANIDDAGGISLTSGASVDGATGKTLNISGTVTLDANTIDAATATDVIAKAHGYAVGNDDVTVTGDDDGYKVNIADGVISGLENIGNVDGVTIGGLSNGTIKTDKIGSFTVADRTFLAIGDASVTYGIEDGKITYVNDVDSILSGDFSDGLKVNGGNIQVTGENISLRADTEADREIIGIRNNATLTTAEGVTKVEPIGAGKFTFGDHTFETSDPTIIFNLLNSSVTGIDSLQSGDLIISQDESYLFLSAF